MMQTIFTTIRITSESMWGTAVVPWAKSMRKATRPARSSSTPTRNHFQLEKDTPRIYVNLPKSHKIAVLDREKHSIDTSWALGMTLANYAMAQSFGEPQV
jgi:hypothetical protein